jgi:hypothetical protein
VLALVVLLSYASLPEAEFALHALLIAAMIFFVLWLRRRRRWVGGESAGSQRFYRWWAPLCPRSFEHVQSAACDGDAEHP